MQSGQTLPSMSSSTFSGLHWSHKVFHAALSCAVCAHIRRSVLSPRRMTFARDTIYVAQSVADDSFLARCPARQVTAPLHATIFVVDHVAKPPPQLLLAALFNGCKIASKAHVTSQGRGAAVQYRCICSRPKNRSLWLSPDFVARNRSAVSVITRALLRPSSNWVLARQRVKIKLQKT